MSEAFEKWKKSVDLEELGDDEIFEAGQAAEREKIQALIEPPEFEAGEEVEVSPDGEKWYKRAYNTLVSLIGGHWCLHTDTGYSRTRWSHIGKIKPVDTELERYIAAAEEHLANLKGMRDER